MTPERWEQVKETFFAALEQAAGKGSSRLREMCKGDEALRAEVESLLSGHNRAGNFMDNPVLDFQSLVDEGQLRSASRTIGERFQILGRAGEGGMGIVYKARDLKLGRTVAIKISAEQFTQRFEREARAVAALNHPDICTLYDVGPNYLVMEYIDGRPLTGPLPVEKTLQYGVRIAGALAAAHSLGIVHRDLKPTNLMVTKSGIKLLDFGLAKISAICTHLDEKTLTDTLTQSGTLLGTLQYMAPEQLQGQNADARSDVFAFGCVLYEMLTGHRAFEGSDPASIIGAILHCEPRPVSEVAVDVPPALDRTLRKCLAKDPERRWQTTSDLRDELQWIAEGAFGEKGQTKSGNMRFAAWITAGLVALLALGYLWPWNRQGPKANWKLSVVAPESLKLAPVGSQRATPEISPDGSSIIFAGSMSNMLYLRRLDMLEPVPLRGVELGSQVFWSPDGKSVGYFTKHELMTMRLPDGPPETISPIPGPPRGGTWGPDGTILFSMLTGDEGSGLYLILGGSRKSVRLDTGELRHGRFFWPELLPNGEDFIVAWESPGSGEVGIYLATLRHDKIARGPILLRKNLTAAHYSPSGSRLFFLQNDNLYAQRLNLNAARLEGEPVLLTRGLASAPTFYLAHFSVSRSGILAWRPGKAALSRITWFDRQGHEVGTAGPAADYFSVALSPDEVHVCAGVPGGVWILTSNQSGYLKIPRLWRPLWSPDGSGLIVTEAPLRAPGRVVEYSVTGSHEPRELTSLPPGNYTSDIAKDGKLLLFSSESSVSAIRLGATTASKLVDTGEQLFTPSFSPDSKWVVYVVWENGTQEIYAQPFLFSGLRKQISASGGVHPVWRRDGKEILYLCNDRICSVQVTESLNGLQFSAARPLFKVRPPPSLVVGVNPLQVSRDGSRIVFPQAIEQSGTQVIDVANFESSEK